MYTRFPFELSPANLPFQFRTPPLLHPHSHRGVSLSHFPISIFNPPSDRRSPTTLFVTSSSPRALSARGHADRSRNSFPCHSYENTPGVPPHFQPSTSQSGTVPSPCHAQTLTFPFTNHESRITTHQSPVTNHDLHL